MHGLFYMFPLEETSYVSFRKSAEKSQITQQSKSNSQLAYCAILLANVWYRKFLTR